MAGAESKVHSFIVKLWVEEAGDGTGITGWHGHITHVPSGARRYLKDLRNIVSFINVSVAEPGADAAPDSRPRSWLKALMRRKK